MDRAVTNPRIIAEYYDFHRKCSIDPHTRRRFHPLATVATPQNAIPPEQVIRHHRSAQSGVGGQALSPPLLYQSIVFHIITKGILKSLFLVIVSCLVLLSLVPVVSAEPICRSALVAKPIVVIEGNPVQFSGSPSLGIEF
jgi:hypothetical protein